MAHAENFDGSLERIANYLIKGNLRLVTAESCTGGMLASACTSRPGSSKWYEGGFVTYRLSAKSQMLNIEPNVIERYGAVSEEIVTLMASQALQHSNAQISIATSGLAGPQGDDTASRIGTLWIAWASLANKTTGAWLQARRFELDRPRAQFRESAVRYAIDGLWQRLVQHPLR